MVAKLIFITYNEYKLFICKKKKKRHLKLCLAFDLQEAFFFLLLCTKITQIFKTFHYHP